MANSLNIDPALLALGQGVSPQPPIHQFNMHPGSQVTFAGNAFQQSFGGNAFQQSLNTQGNQNMRVEGTEPPANNADQANEDAHMFDASTSDDNTFLSKYEFAPTMPEYGLDSLDSKPDPSHGLMLPRPLPPKALVPDTGNIDYVVYAQRDIVHSAAPSDVFSPELMNSGEGHTVGGASAMEESGGYPRSNASPRKKRRRSSSDDGSSNFSIDNAGESFLSLHHIMSSSMRARITKPSPSFSSGESQLSISMSRRESLLAADYSGVKVARPRKGMSPKEAAERCFRRVRLNISGGDNVAEVKAEREKWLDAIMQVFDAPYNETPQAKNIDLQSFEHWQKEHHALTMEQFEEDPTDDLAEAVATYLYSQVVDGHEEGSLVESCGKSFKYDTKLNCKDRLEKIIKVLTGLTIIRFDVVTGARVNELVANPDAVFKRKEENKLENDRKKIKKEAAEAAKTTNKKKVSTLKVENGNAQNHNKRSVQSKYAVVEDDEESSSGSDDHSDPEDARPSALVAASITEPKSVDPINNDESSNGPGDEHLAPVPEALPLSARGVSTSIPVSKPVKPVNDDESSSDLIGESD